MRDLERSVLLALIEKEQQRNPLLFLRGFYTPKPKQIIAHEHPAKYLLYGGAMGGGKSWYLCAEALMDCLQYPGNRVLVVRKELSVIKTTTLVTFFSVCPPQYIKSYNKADYTVTFTNGSILMFREANISRDPLLNKFKSMEIGSAYIDEANEVSDQVYTILKTRLRWTLPEENIYYHHIDENGKKCPRYKIRLSSNPEDCWLVPTFLQSKNEQEAYVESLTTDNYDANSEYVQGLMEAFKDNPTLLDKYLKGDWSVVAAFNQLISPEGLYGNAGALKGSNLIPIALGADIARYGDDSTCITIIKDSNIHKRDKFQHADNVAVANKIEEYIKSYNIPHNRVGIDSIGMAGVVDTLRSRGYRGIIELIGSEKPLGADEPKKHPKLQVYDMMQPTNRRSQMYIWTKYVLDNHLIGNVNTEELQRQLAAVRYQFVKDRKCQIADKEVMKKLLNGKSPDDADSLVYAVAVGLCGDIFSPKKVALNALM